MQQFNFPTTIFFGAGSVAALVQVLKNKQHQQILLVTGKMLCDLGIPDYLTTQLQQANINYTIFTDYQDNPVENNIVAGKQVYQDKQCDAIIALGGGAPLDVAKAIKVLATHPEPLSQYDEANGGDALITQPMPPLYAIPTTAGTGSEVGRASVIILNDTGKKSIIFHPDLMPDIAVLEPQLCVDLPPIITAATGIDALTHSIEAYLAPTFHPMADGIALQSIQLIVDNLPIAIKQGQDLTARGHMLLAAAMGATAFQKGLGMVHSMAHPLSAVYNTHHGLANALLLADTMAFLEAQNLSPTHQQKLSTLNALFTTTPHQQTQLSATLRQFITETGIELGLRHHQIPQSGLKSLSELAMEDPCHNTNMIPVTVDNFLTVLTTAY